MRITTTDGGDGVATITLDDGKVNAFDRAFFDEMDAALDGCAGAAAVVVAGRPGMFSAGLNTRLLTGLDRGGLADLLVAFGRTMLRVWLEPRPVVAAATGHAIAGGTLLAMACDHAVAAVGDYRWGLVETTVGFPLPGWAIALARGNVAADRLDDLLLPGRSVDVDAALQAGFADAAVEPGAVVTAAHERARELAALPRLVYAETKRRLRRDLAAPALATIEADVAGLLAARAP